MVAGMGFVAILAAGIVMAAAMAAFMTGMDILAVEPFYECGYELTVGNGTGMNIEAYDTEAVPQDKQECRYLYQSFPDHQFMQFKLIQNFNNLQNYKFSANNKPMLYQKIISRFEDQ